MVIKTHLKCLLISIIAVVISLAKDVECCSSVKDTGTPKEPRQLVSDTSKYVQNIKIAKPKALIL